MIKTFINNTPAALIKEVAYCTEVHNMRIIFRSGSSYIYESVPEKVFNDFISSESLSKYFAMYIKDRYFFSKMDAEEFAALKAAIRQTQENRAQRFVEENPEDVAKRQQMQAEFNTRLVNILKYLKSFS